MKNVLCTLVLVFLLTAAPISAQIENIATGDSSVVINLAYAGLLSQTNFSYDSLSSTNLASLAAGFQATYQPAQWFSLIAINGYGINEKSKVSTFARFWGKAKYEDMQIEFGLAGALSTESRPLFITSAGQFESWTEGTIPGGGLGIKLKYNIGKNYIGLGVVERNNLPEYHLRYSSKQWKVSLYYPQYSKKFGGSVRFDGESFCNVIAFSAGQTVGNYSSIKIGSSQDIEIYFDLGHSIATEQLVKLEVGLLKKITSPILKGAIGLAYDNHSRAVIGYLFVHI